MKHNNLQPTSIPLLLILGLGGCLTADKLNTQASSGPPGSAGSGGSGASGGSGGTGGSGMVAGPSAEFVAIYNDVFAPRCGPCHVTNMPRSGMLDLGDATAAFTNLINGMTMCAAATEKRRVVAGNADESYLIKKLLGTQPMAMGCGQRMPRTPMRSMAPSCQDGITPGGAGPLDDVMPDAGARDAAGMMDAAPPDALAADAAPQPPPRMCLSPAEVDRVRAWIQGGAR